MSAGVIFRFLVLFTFLVVGGWYHCVTYTPPGKEFYADVNGEVRSAERTSLGNNRFWDVFLTDNPVRFRVDLSEYPASVNRRELMAAAAAGSRVTFQVEKAELRKPITPAPDARPTVFVWSVEGKKGTFSAVKGHSAAVENHHRITVKVTYVVTVAWLLLLVKWRLALESSSRPLTPAAAAIPLAPCSLEEK